MREGSCYQYVEFYLSIVKGTVLHRKKLISHTVYSFTRVQKFLSNLVKLNKLCSIKYVWNM